MIFFLNIWQYVLSAIFLFLALLNFLASFGVLTSANAKTFDWSYTFVLVKRAAYCGLSTGLFVYMIRWQP